MQGVVGGKKMKDIILPCCGELVPAPPREINCPKCGTHFTEVQVDSAQLEELSSVPVVDVVRAARMLNRPQEWIVQQKQLLDPIPAAALGLDFVFPLTAIRRFATELGLPIKPLAAGVALWIRTAR